MDKRKTGKPYEERFLATMMKATRILFQGANLSLLFVNQPARAKPLAPVHPLWVSRQMEARDITEAKDKEDRLLKIADGLQNMRSQREIGKAMRSLGWDKRMMKKAGKWGQGQYNGWYYKG